jgi:hypothetical protein
VPAAPAAGTPVSGAETAPATSPPAAAAATGAVSPTPPPAAAEPEGPTATLLARFDGTPFPVRLFVDGRRFETSGGRAVVPAGRVRVRVVSDAAFFARDLGVIELKPGDRRQLSFPATTATSIDVTGGAYEGLQIAVDGRQVPGPYPAQIRQIVQGTHQINFRWVSGQHQGKAFRGTADLTDGRVFRIVGSPQDERVTVQKLR